MYATSARSAGAPEGSSRKRRYASARAESAAGLRAERGSSTTDARPSGAGAAGGGSCSTTCALVPLMPKELTPAIRGAPPDGHGSGAAGTANGVPSSEIRGFSVWKCRCLGISSWRSESATLMNPATPAAASRWPMFVTEPIQQGSPSGRGPPSTSFRAVSSIGSPSEVPVPCAST
ncbi:hypothetical protein BE20_28320 [Sorangium cellulosum]|nr:hypothetical protein BE20_28320 [Sorangium cellulosum]